MDFEQQATSTFQQPNINAHTHVPIDLGDDGRSQRQPDISYIDEVRLARNNNNNFHTVPQNLDLHHSKNQKDFS